MIRKRKERKHHQAKMQPNQLFIILNKKNMYFFKGTTLLFLLFVFSNIYADTKTIFVDEFKSLELSGYFNVTLVQGNSNEVTINASEKLISFVQINATASHLSIAFNEHPGPFRIINITIKFTQLEEIESRIHGYLNTKGFLNLENLFLDIISYKPANLQLNVHKIDIDASGKGKIQLIGHTKKANINTSMIGEFDASKFVADYLNVDASGSGNILVNAKVEASTNNTGWLKISGGAPVVDSCPLEFG